MTADGRPDPQRLSELAALDAGVLDPARAAAVRAAAATDPRAQEVLAALAATRTALAALRDPPVPPEVSTRWAAAVDDLASARTSTVRARKRLRLPRPLRLAVVAAAVLVATALPPADVVRIGPESHSEVLTITRVDLLAVGRTALGTAGLGPLADPDRLAECLSAVGVMPTQPPLGGRQVLLDGHPGTLLVLATGQLGRFRLLVVDTACGAGGGRVLADETMGA